MKTGIHKYIDVWIPALAEMTIMGLVLFGMGCARPTTNPVIPAKDFGELGRTAEIHPVDPPVDSRFYGNDKRESVTLRFVGDIMLDRNVAKRSRDAHDGTYPFRKLPEGWLNEADFTIGNLEGPLTATRRPPEKSIDFAFDPSLVAVLKEQGIDSVSQANNHALDQGARGYEESVHTLRTNGIGSFGHQVRDDASVAYTTTTIKGVTIAFVGFNTTDNPLDKTEAEKTLTLAREQATHVIVMMHWGSEYHATPDASVIATAHWLIDHGATAIIGGHPHWAQGVEVYRGAPIVYSLGNFIFDQDFSEETKQGLAVDLALPLVVSAKAGTYPASLRLYPVHIIASQPSLDTHPESRLAEIAKRSSPELADQIRQGEIFLP